MVPTLGRLLLPSPWLARNCEDCVQLSKAALFSQVVWLMYLPGTLVPVRVCQGSRQAGGSKVGKCSGGCKEQGATCCTGKVSYHSACRS
jgi:hypothetical protein